MSSSSFTNCLKIKRFSDSLQFSYYRVHSVSNSSSSPASSDISEVRRCSISRSISKVKDIVKSNHFDYFFTLTLKDSLRYDIPAAIKFINSSIRSYRRKSLSFFHSFIHSNESNLLLGNNEETGKHNNDCDDYDFKYVYVFELTKNGGIHLHGFFSGFYDLYINKYGYLSSHFFDNIGFQNFIPSDKVNEFYLIKYMSKEFLDITPQRYYRSRNLKSPIVDKFYDNNNYFLNFSWGYRDKFCDMITIRD